MRRSTRWLGVAALVLVVIAVYAPALRNGFVWDDWPNVVRNPHLEQSPAEVIGWAFSTFRLGHYQPLTWLSLALDRALWGDAPMGYHVTSILLHALNALLFAVLARRLLVEASRAGGGPPDWVDLGALFAAAVFALHPMRVESVAWVTERRDVLSGVFFLLSATAFLRYVRGPSGTRRYWYVASVVLFAASLLSKALALTFPVVLLILDVYPLRRFEPGRAGRLLIEKLPLFALSTGFGVAALLAQADARALTALGTYSPVQRLAQMAYSAVFYPRQVFALAWYPLYDRPAGLDPFESRFVLSGLVFVLVTVVLWSQRRRFPAGLAAWLCYLVLLAPMSGIAQSGVQLVADRYSYLAGLAWALPLGGGAAYLWHRGRGALRPVAAIFVVLTLIGSWSVMTRQQVAVWRDDATLWRHVLGRGPSAMAYNNLGSMALERGETGGALILFGRALETAPTYGRAWTNLLVCLERGGGTVDREAFARVVTTLTGALPHHDESATAWYTLGLAHAALADHEAALRHLRKAVEIDPDHLRAWNRIGRLLAASGRNDEAREAFGEALRIRPDDPQARAGLAGLPAGEAS